MKKQKRGKFIVIEGLDGSGKSRQAERIYRYLQEPQNKLVFGYHGAHLTREPTPNLIGGLIGSQLSHDWHSSQECLQLLFAADRAYHLEKEVLPLLEKGVVVVSDRYFFSSYAYGATDAKTLRWLLAVNKNFPTPDLTFYLDVSPKTCLERIHGERYAVALFEKREELARVRKNYLNLAKKIKNVFLIRGEEPIEDVTRQIVAILNRKL
jgi:dTMP kinase